MSRWRTFELMVYNYYCNHLRQQNYWNVVYDWKIDGHSGPRQIDILLTSKIINTNIVGIIDCKCYRTVIDVKNVESVIGMMDDTQANFGVIVSPIGFTKGAKKRADDFGRIELIKLNFQDLFPYRFINNPIIDISCPNCYGKKNIFGISDGIVDLSSYDIVYDVENNDYFKVNNGFCKECLNHIFYCNECRTYIAISLNEINYGIRKPCKCGINYSFYSYHDDFNDIQITHSYYDKMGNELFSESNAMYLLENMFE